ncbi:MAG: NUDIX domain-containing protein [Candidatus Pacearchaeota archaeon]
MIKASTVICINNKKEILLLLRDNKPEIDYPNTWGLIGGHLEKNETPIQALIREVKEEINYELVNPVYIGNIRKKISVFKEKINKKINELELNEGQKIRFFKYKDILRQKNIPKILKDFILKYKEKIYND